MSKKLYLILLLLAVLPFTSCEKGDAPAFTLPETELSFGVQGGSAGMQLAFTNTSNWTVECDQEWLSTNLTAGTQSAIYLSITCGALPKSGTRTGTVTISALGTDGASWLKSAITVTQEGVVIANYKATALRNKSCPSEKLVAGSQTQVLYSIILPEDYETSQAKYPVLYLLHGMWGNQNSWLTDGDALSLTEKAVKSGSIPPCIVVMPNGYNAFYCNGYENNYQYKDFFFDEFVPYIERTYPVDTSTGHRAVGGLSMGGFGTLYYATLHPEMFVLGYAMSPAIMNVGGINLSTLATETAASATQLPQMVIAVGTNDYVVYAGNTAAYTSYYDTLISAKYKASLETYSGYAHEWGFWQLCYPKLLAVLGKLWQ